MPHYAELDPNTNTVLRVIVADTAEWCEQNLGGMWARTYYSTSGKVYAGIGYTYYPEHENFSPPQPYPSWTLDTATMMWEPPVPYPSDPEAGVTVEYVWDEATISWVPV
jgi:hypothetical protein